jgi:hypothetical protein
VNFATYVTWSAVAEDELNDSAASVTALAAVSVNGIDTATGSDVVDKLRLLLPALETLVTPSAVRTTESPALASMPVAIVTALPPADTVAVKHPWDWCVRESVIV